MEANPTTCPTCILGISIYQEAQKRVLLKRYLRRHEIPFDQDWPTLNLRQLVKFIHRSRLALA